METIYKENDIIEDFEVFPEKCCDECSDVAHNHIDCPVCKNSYASTDCYGYLSDSDILICEECYSKFELVEGCWFSYNKVKVVKIGERK